MAADCKSAGFSLRWFKSNPLHHRALLSPRSKRLDWLRGDTPVPDLIDNPLHLGLGATAVVEPTFSGMAWYADYVARHADDGAEGRLVTLYTFSEPWTSWEMHPAGEEVVICTFGSIMLIQESADGGRSSLTLGPGEYGINPRGIWHTADIGESATVLFITAGWGTQHRPR